MSKNITNDDGNGGDSGGGGIIDVNVQTMTGEITLARYGGLEKWWRGGSRWYGEGKWWRPR